MSHVFGNIMASCDALLTS